MLEPWVQNLIDLDQALRDGRADLRDAINAIPQDLRERLSAGPHPRRFTCGVCQAVGRDWYMGRACAMPSLTDPMWVVFGFHEIPKIQMKTANQQWYGPLANDVYARCIEIYVRAGWEGDPEEPNA